MKLQDVKKPKLYTMRETAEFMGISYNTIHRMVRDGRIQAVNVAKSGTKAIWGISAEAIQLYYDKLPNSDKRVETKHQ